MKKLTIFFVVVALASSALAYFFQENIRTFTFLATHGKKEAKKLKNDFIVQLIQQYLIDGNYEQARVECEKLLVNKTEIDPNIVLSLEYLLGKIYLEGLGCATDFERARLLFEDVVKNAHKLDCEQANMALFFLAEIFYASSSPDYVRAADLLNEIINSRLEESSAALQWARGLLGIMHYAGSGVDLNYQKASELFNAVINGPPASRSEITSMAMLFLGKMYYYGQGVEQSFPEAKKLLTSLVLDENTPLGNKEEARQMLDFINKEA